MSRLTHYLKDGRTAAEPKNRAEGLAFAAKLADYEDAEENKILLRLPCPLGSDIYYITLNKRAFCKVRKGTLTENNFFTVLRDFGKSVFSSREEAEAELKRREQS